MDPTNTPPKRSIPWRLPLALLVVLALLVAVRSVETPPSADAPADGADRSPAGETGQTVTLTQRGGTRGVDPVAVPWREGQTVLDATRLADERAPETWSSRWRGDGPMAFLEELGGVENQGADGLNWQFEINDAYATHGAGGTPLESGDRVLWKLAPYE